MNRTLAFSLRTLAAAALISAWQIPVSAQDMDSSGQNSKYDSMQARCEQMSGSQKESCMKQAEKKKNKESNSAEHKQMKEEKKKCEAMSGADKDNCMQELKAKYHH